MKTTSSNIFGSHATFRTTPSSRSLSYYFPPHTAYFYGYPAGEGSDFINLVPPETEELVAARTFCCAGKDISVISFAATSNRLVSPKVRARLRLPIQLPKQTIVLPLSIGPKLHGKDRNNAVKIALRNHVAPGHLIMAQPFTDSSLQSLYQIPSSLSYYFNDKKNLSSFIDASLLPQRLGEYTDGESFANAVKKLPLPIVIKASASSSGDGVYLCRTAADRAKAITKLRHSEAYIIVEQYIDAVKNYGVHFGIPADKSKPIDIIGVNEQLTSSEGSFLGGIIRSTAIPRELWRVLDYLQHEALPKVRAQGWYGIGGLDVLIDHEKNAFIIDGNFRMTGMSAYHFMVQNGQLPAPLISFSGSFKGTERELILALGEPLHEGDKLQIIAITHHEGIWRFNGALCYVKEHQLGSSITELLDRGIRSDALEQIVAFEVA